MTSNATDTPQPAPFDTFEPRHRPDMSFHIFGKALIEGDEIVVFGDGRQTRDFTYVADIVEANMRAVSAPGVEGGVFNIAGGSRVSLRDAIDTLEELSGRSARLRHEIRDPLPTDWCCNLVGRWRIGIFVHRYRVDLELGGCLAEECFEGSWNKKAQKQHERDEEQNGSAGAHIVVKRGRCDVFGGLSHDYRQDGCAHADEYQAQEHQK